MRLVLDWTDHVWVEQWSAAQEKWVHMDPCEAAYDKPLLYSVGCQRQGKATFCQVTLITRLNDESQLPACPQAGWGKKLSYVTAVGRDGVADVSRRYSKDWQDLLTRRTLVTEGGCVHLCTAQALKGYRKCNTHAPYSYRTVQETAKTKIPCGAASCHCSGRL